MIKPSAFAIILAGTLILGISLLSVVYDASRGNENTAIQRFAVNRTTPEQDVNESFGTTPQWQEYHADMFGMKLLYPKTWEVTNHTPAGTILEDAFFVQIRMEQRPNGPTPAFTVMIEKKENGRQLDCEAWLREESSREKEALMQGGGINESDAEEFLHGRFEPVQKVTIAGYQACKPPVVNTTEYYEEQYYIAWKDRMYVFRFPTEDSPDSIILDAKKNYKLARQILDSVVLE